MPKPVATEHIQAILDAAFANPEGVDLAGVIAALPADTPRRTVQDQLRKLVDKGRLTRHGQGRSTRYLIPSEPRPGRNKEAAEQSVRLSVAAREIQRAVRQPLESRTPTAYQREFLEDYQPNHSFYFSARERKRLRKIGTQVPQEQPAGTYLRQVLSRLLIDLSWNSSRLEGNTYSLLDTRRLIDYGKVAERKGQLEAQMILNHKAAIEFIADPANEVAFNRHSILGLHGLLAENLLEDPEAAGRLRSIGVGIGKSVYHPSEIPQVIDECFNLILRKAQEIQDPFEQSLFAMVQLPYLQAFDDVNKRVSRLAANIPLVRHNLAPLSFIEVPTDLYMEATLAVYELNRTELLRDVYLWAYERSAQRYKVVRQTVGQPDPFRMRYRDELKEAVRSVVLEVVRNGLDRPQAFDFITAWVEAHVGEEDRERFQNIVETEVAGLHEGNFPRHKLRPAEFRQWHELWNLPSRQGHL